MKPNTPTNLGFNTLIENPKNDIHTTSSKSKDFLGLDTPKVEEFMKF